ncbi:DUF4350 domain-containing protein [Arcanobacterium bovis]|uniref:DUF4350 domain-containing protein n=1 Tax=Arcanobacterium bovis TaxID=2529275 RepID=A0A4Q9V1W2_9ACTO|nr:DUF4350 domain-containing protein [Arcanobacterium bovis]TBW23619.1 DUF4350 domain-containing protein [Arcanobacterium bovis]
MNARTSLDTKPIKQLSRSESKTRRLLAAVLVGAALVAVIANIFLVSSNDNRPYSPDSTAKNGSAAIAALLKNEGITVEHVRTAKQLQHIDSQTTVLVTNPVEISNDDISLMVEADARIIVLGASGVFDPTPWGFQGDLSLRSSRSVVADCEDNAAKIADQIGPTTTTIGNPPSDSCFMIGNEAVWATAPKNPKISFFGAPDILTNQFLDERGNAAFAMHILGSQPKLAWIEGYSSFEFKNDSHIKSALPDWLTYGAIAALLSGLWLVATQLRRFGRLVPETMPVVVPIGETQAGRARLYARGKDYAYAASVLRAATIQNLASRYGLHRYSSRDDVVAAFAAASQRTPNELADMLYTRQIRSERDLRRLNEDLNELTKEISHEH